MRRRPRSRRRVQDFQNPDVQAAQKATAVSFRAQGGGLKAPAPSQVSA